MDKLTECKRCGGNACYEQQLNEKITTWLCMGCGFSTSTELYKDSPLVKSTLETSPELYKDLMFEDLNNNVWFPATITLPEKGMVFVDGTSKNDQKWSAVKAIPISEDDRKLKNYSESQTHRMDMVNASKFGHKDFMDALEVIGFFNADVQ